MICRNCQREIAEYSNFCYFCGARQQTASQNVTTARKRLMRSSTDSKVAGVCGGFAEYLEVDSAIVRLVWVFLMVLPVPVVPAVLGYFAAWIIMPKAPRPRTVQATSAQATESS